MRLILPGLAPIYAVLSEPAYALTRLVAEGVVLRPFSDEILAAARAESLAYLEELAAAEPSFRRVFEPWKKFREINYVNIRYRPFDASTWPQGRAVRSRVLPSGPDIEVGLSEWEARLGAGISWGVR